VRLRRVEVGRLPGIDEAFRIEGLAPGLNLVLGPNASGKSSICRAVRATLWPEMQHLDRADVVSLWDREGVALRAELGARVRWQRDGVDADPPPLPDEHLADCYTVGLRDLLTPDGETDRDLADRIRVRMAGGYDLRPVAARFEIRRTHGRTEEREVSEAERELRRLEGERRRLAEEEDGLAALRAQLEDARSAAAECEQLREALALARLRLELAAVERQLEPYPAAMATLRGDELERLDEIYKEVADTQRDLEDLMRRIEEANAAVHACRLPDGPVDDATLNEWIERARKLDFIGTERNRAVEQERQAIAAADQARRLLGAEAEGIDLAGLDGAALDEVDAWVAEAHSLRERRRALEARLMGAAPEDNETAPTLDDLRRGRDALRDWLASAAPPTWIVGPRVRTSLAVAAIAAAAGAIFIHPAFWPVAGAAIGALALSLFAGAMPGTERASAETRFRQLPLDPPASWRHDAVRSRLEVLEASVLAAQRAHDHRVEREAIQQQIGELANQQRASDGTRRGLAERLPIDPGVSDLRLAELAGRIRDWRAAEQRRTEAAATIEGHDEDRRRRLEKICAFLRGRVDQEPKDALGAQSLLDDLKDRGASWRRADQERAAAERERTRCERRIGDLERNAAEILRRAGLDPGDAATARAALKARLEDLDAYRGGEEERRRHERSIAEVSARLAATPELLDLDVEGAQRQLGASEERASHRERLASEISVVEERVRVARSDGALEQSLARVDAAGDALAERRDELLHAAAGRLLLEEVEEEHELSSRPAVLRRAMEYFSAFTRHHYELRLQTDHDPVAFRALETRNGRGLGLDELSDGTRMQLLLAARLAFATQAEVGTPLPLFLDEALTASDPARFRAIAESLLVLAREGRQIFYLTCNPADVGHWQAIAAESGDPAPHLIDLAAARRLGGGALDSAALRLPEREEVPAPDGASAAEYGTRLGVAAPNPFAPPESVHLFHLLRGDLPLLHRLLDRARIERLGHWRALSRSGAADTIVSGEERAHIDAVADLVDAFLESWRIGRGRPVDRDALAESGAVSEAFLERLTDLAGDIQGDAQAFLSTLEERSDERTRGFRSRSLDALRTWLEERGYIASRPRLSLAEVRTQVIARVADALRGGALSVATANDRIDELWALMSSPSHSER
jgi:energy-coupling factor transporter ATP-binding protein EcfA2